MLYLTILYSCWDVVQTLKPAKKQLVLIRFGDWNCWSSLNSGMEVLQLSAVYNLLVTLDKPQYYDSSVFTTDSMQSPFDNLLIARVSKPILSSEDNLLILLCYASVLFLPLFLFGFFFPLSLLFWVTASCCCFCLLCYLGSGLPSLLFAYGSNKPTVFPLSIWETDFTCAKILLSYKAVVLTSILKSCQLIFSIYPTTLWYLACRNH